MGQKFGRPIAFDSVLKFVNLPREALESLWASYNLLCEGWGVNLSDLTEIINGANFLKDNLEITEADVELLFQVLDTDNNGLIDALECIAALCCMSGMDVIDKLFFVFSLYDFESTGALSRNEVTLLLSSAISGFSKLCTESQIPTGFDVSTYVDMIFRSADKDSSPGAKISAQEFQVYCCIQPEFSSWIRYMSSAAALSAVNEYDADSDTEATIASYEVAPKLRTKADKVPKPVRTDAPLWFNTADLGMPDELPPALKRKDVPEDVVEPIWIHGYCAGHSRCNVRYGITVPATEGKSKQSVVLVPVGNTILAMSKQEDGSWSQNRLGAHMHPISCLETDQNRKLCASADHPSGNAYCSIVIWDLSNGSPKCQVRPPGLSGVRCMDFSCDAKYLLIVGNDSEGSIYIYDTTTLKLVFGTSMQTACASYNTNTVLDARFCGTNSMFVVANGSNAGAVDFFVDESGSFMGDSKCHIFNHHPGLFQKMGKDACGVPVTALSKFEFPDELIVGNASGQVMYWRGRNCLQLIEAHEKRAVTTIAYEPSCKLLVTGGKDCKIRLFKAGLVSRETKDRQIELAAVIDVMGCSNIISHSIRSLCLYEDGSKVLVSVKSGDVFELSCVNEAVNAEGAGSAAKFGEDVNGGPIMRSHWHKIIYRNSTAPAESLVELQLPGTELPGSVKDGGSVAASNTISRAESADKLGAGSTAGSVAGSVVGGIEEQKLDELFPEESVTYPKVVKITGLCKVAGGFLSCATDGVVRRWTEGEGNVHTCAKFAELDSGCSAMAVSSNLVVVAYDGLFNIPRKGAIHIMKLDSFNAVCTVTGCRDTITSLQVSSDGSVIVSATTGGAINVYKTSDNSNWQLTTTLNGHTDTVIGMDLSTDSQILRSLDSNEQLIFWDLATGAAIDNRDVIKVVQWRSFSCPASWDVKNAWSARSVKGSDRFNHVFVSSDSTDEVAVTRTPSVDFASVDKPSLVRKIHAHSGGVSALCFLEDGSKLITAGAVDGCIQVWAITYDTEEPEVLPEPVEGEEGAPAAEAEEEEDEEDEQKFKYLFYDSADDEDKDDGFDVIRYVKRRKCGYKLVNSIAPEPLACSTDPLSRKFECYSASDRWLKDSAGITLEDVIVFNNATNRTIVAAPNDEFMLAWVHGGYAGRSTRSSVLYSKSGKIIYPVGSIAVCYDKITNEQTYFLGHNSDITAMDIHPKSGVVASVQSSVDDVVLCLWNGDTCECLRRISCGALTGASAIAFSPCGTFVAVACLDPSHTVLIFNWKMELLYAKYYGGPNKVLCLKFSNNSGAGSFGDNRLRIFQGGMNHFALVDIPRRNVANFKTGLYGLGGKKLNILSCAALPAVEGGNEFIVGCSDGSIGLIGKGDRKIAQFNPILEKGAVTSLWVCKLKDATADEPLSYQILLAGTQGHIKVLDMEFAPVSEYNLYSSSINYGLHLLGQVFGVKSLCADKSNTKMLIGTSCGEILELRIVNGEDINEAPLVKSHFAGELLAMDVHPSRQECVTVSDDKTLCVWDLESHKQMNRIDLPDMGRCVTCAPNGFLIAVGLGAEDLRNLSRMPRHDDGKVVIISYMQNVLRIIHEASDCIGAISAVQFSPDSGVLYTGSRCKKICMYDALNNFSLLGILDDIISEPIRNIDITVDGAVLGIQGDQDKLVLYNVENSRSYHLSEHYDFLNGADWYSRKITIGTDTVGVFPPYGESLDVACLRRSHDKKLMATGDVWGNVNIFNYPATLPQAACLNFRAHSATGGVSQVAFTINDQFLLSAGKKDKCVLQWRIKRSSAPIEALPDNALIVKKKNVKPRTNPDEVVGNFKAVDFTIGTFPYAKAGDSSREVDIQLKQVLGINQPLISSNMPKAIYAGTGDTVFYSGSVACRITANKDKQSLWQTSIAGQSVCKDVNAVQLSEDGRYLFIGYGDRRAHDFDIFAKGSYFVGKVTVLDAVTGREVTVLDESVFGGVNGISASACGKYVACLCGDDHNTLKLYHSPTGTWADDSVTVYSGKVGLQKLNIVSFIMQRSQSLVGSALVPDMYQLVTGGVGKLRFWKLNGEGNHCTSSFADYANFTAEGVVAGDCVGAISLSPGETITADTNGNVFSWCGLSCTGCVAGAHYDGAITSIVKRSATGVGIKIACNFLTSSALEIIFWNEMVPCRRISVESCLTRLGLWTSRLQNISKVTSIDVDSACQRLLLNCYSGISSAVVEIAVDSENPLLVTEGNIGSNLVMDVHPKDPSIFAVGSDTGYLKLWTHAEGEYGGNHSRCLAREILGDNKITAVKYTGDGSLLGVGIIGYFTGCTENVSSVLFLATEDGLAGVKLRTVSRISNIGVGSITCMQFSSNGSSIAIGSTCGNLFVYCRRDQESAYSLHAKLPVALGVQSALDFSMDGKYLRSFGISYEPDRSYNEDYAAIVSCSPQDLHFFDLFATDGSPESAEVAVERTDENFLIGMRDNFSWSSVSSVFVPDAKGIADLAAAEGVSVTSTDLSGDGAYLAVGYDSGAVRVFKYPCCSVADIVEVSTNSVPSHNAGSKIIVKFCSDTSHLLSINASDGAIFEWTVGI